MVKKIQKLIFISLQIPLLPVSYIGLKVSMRRNKEVSKKLGISYTAGQVIHSHWFTHYFRTRRDETTVKFFKSFPAKSHKGFLGLMSAAIISNRLCGFTPSLAQINIPQDAGIMNFINPRVKDINEIFEKNIENVEQVVVMGAGFDLRTVKYTKGKNLKVFELDQEKTQKVKLATLEKAKIEHDWINYVPIDFNTESWVEKLLEAGFEKGKKTFFLWESVSLYLEESIVRDTLTKVADICGSGSVITQDFYSTEFMDGTAFPRMKRSVDLMKEIGEPWLFGIDMSQNTTSTIEKLINETGFDLNEITLYGENKTSSKNPFYAIAVATKA